MASASIGALRDHPIRDLLDQSDEGVVCCQPGFQIIFANTWFKNFFEPQRNDIVVGASLKSILNQVSESPESLGSQREWDEWFAKLDTGRADQVFKFRPDRWFRFCGTRTSPDGLTLTVSDVTTFKKREAWLTELHDRLAGEGEDLKHFARHLALARAEVTVALNQAEQANAALQKEIGERRNLERELRKLANTDELTGALNRRRFMELTLQENTRARRQDEPLTILMIDLDHFKSINDLYGHEAGDEVLRQFSNVCKTLFQDGDLFARLGGEEFAALLPETDVESAMLQAERIRSAIESLRVYHAGDVISFTASIGVAEIDAEDKAPLAFIGRADRALYHAKRSGRNCVCLYSLDLEQTSIGGLDQS